MALVDRIDKAIGEIDLRIAKIEAMAREEVKELKTRRRALIDAKRTITPDIETTIAALQAVGINILG